MVLALQATGAIRAGPARPKELELWTASAGGFSSAAVMFRCRVARPRPVDNWGVAPLALCVRKSLGIFTAHRRGRRPEDDQRGREEVAFKEGWWGDLVPLAPPVDLTGNWVGTWKGLGLFDSLRRRRPNDPSAERNHRCGPALHDETTVASVPWSIRYCGGRTGVRVG